MLARAKRGALLVNNSRGGLIDTEAVIEALKSGRLGGGAQCDEQEPNLFFRDLSSTIIADDVIQRLLSFPNVIITGHQAFFTQEAIATIARPRCAACPNSLPVSRYRTRSRRPEPAITGGGRLRGGPPSAWRASMRPRQVRECVGLVL